MVRIKVADYVAKFVESRNIKHVFTVTGGGAMFLNDAFARCTSIKGVFNHHEQACAMAAAGYTKVHNEIAVVMPTTGCGGTNTITGLLDAWQDSNKVVYISGNVNKKETTYCSEIPLRKFGVQEANIVEIVKSITKYAVMVTDPNMIAYHLEKAFYLCESGRPGPVWIDIPLDIQGSMVDESELAHYSIDEDILPKTDYAEFVHLLQNAKRPIVVAGYGIHLGNARKEFINFIETYNLPVVFTYLGVDLLPSNHPLYVGRLGTKGDRAGNFAIQNSDLVISLGSSLSVSVTGFRYETFAREANIVVVDIDPHEHKKNTISIDLEYNVDIKTFFKEVPVIQPINFSDWVSKCIGWRDKWPVFDPVYYDTANGINIYHFLHKLSSIPNNNIITISDAGSAYYATSQALQIANGQRYITSGAQADMGFTLPACIGAAFADQNATIFGITGDGSFQMNIQELQTIVNYSLPIKLCVLNNGGYLSIRNTMDKFFNSRYYGTDASSGLSFPSVEKIALAYGLPYHRLENTNDMLILNQIANEPGPALIEVMCPYKQEIIPSSSTKQNDEGKLVSQPLENMYPFLSDDDFRNEMIIKPL